MGLCGSHLSMCDMVTIAFGTRTNVFSGTEIYVFSRHAITHVFGCRSVCNILAQQAAEPAIRRPTDVCHPEPHQDALTGQGDPAAHLGTPCVQVRSLSGPGGSQLGRDILRGSTAALRLRGHTSQRGLLGTFGDESTETRPHACENYLHFKWRTPHTECRR